MAARLSLVISESSVSVANNTSVVTAKLYYYGNGVSYNYNSKPGTIVIDGTSYSFSASFTKSTSAQLLATKSKTVTHNSNGAKTVSCSASYTTGVSIGTLSTSASKALTTIPRVSDLSLNKTSVPADGSTTVIATATKKSSGFTDTITVKLGSYSKTVTSGTAFTIPATWINAISGTSATATVTVTTKSGSTTIGTKSVNLTVTVPSTVVPSISSVTVAEAVTAVQSAFGSGVYVSSLSKLNVSISAAGVYGSTISSVKTTFDGITYDGASFQTAAISKAGTLSMSVTVTDSRGRTKTTTKNITVYGYSSPMITNISCVSSGTSTIVTVDGVVSPVAVGSANKNTKTLTIGYKKSTASAYGGTTTVTIPAASWTFSVSKTFSLDSRTITYDFEAKLKDKLSTATEHGTTGVPVISRLAGGGGVTLFKEAEEEGFVVGGNSVFEGDLNCSGAVRLTKTTNLSGTSNTNPALITGNPTGQHIEFDTNEIQSKASASTTGILHLNYKGGDVTVNGNKIGAIVKTDTVSKSCATATATTITSLSLSAGRYVIIGFVDWTTSYNNTYNVYLQNADGESISSPVRNSMLSGGGINISGMLEVTGTDTAILKTYQSSGSTRTARGWIKAIRFR